MMSGPCGCLFSSPAPLKSLSPFKPRWSLLHQVSLFPHLPLSQFTSRGLGIVLETQLLSHQFLSLASGLHLPHFSGLLLFLGQNPKSCMWHWRLHTVWPSPPPPQTHFTASALQSYSPRSSPWLPTAVHPQGLCTCCTCAHVLPSSPTSPADSYSSQPGSAILVCREGSVAR